jgi:putative pyruvate formate lyase activating enzyme
MGRAVSAGEFAAICLALEKEGAENINLVTGSHAIPVLAEGIRAAKERGLSIPVLWNSSAYETPQALRLLSGLVDVYLPDLKTLDREVARRFFGAADYPERAVRAILWMLENRGHPVYRPAQGGPDRSASAETLASGVIIRHLILPGFLDASRGVIRWFAEHARGRALLSLMTQYTPVTPVEGTLMGEWEAPRRYVSREEYGQARLWLEEFGIEEGFYQELATDSEWLPDFNRANPFSSELSRPVWHWREGFIRRASPSGDRQKYIDKSI